MLSFLSPAAQRSTSTQIKSPAGSSSGAEGDSRGATINKDKDNATVRLPASLRHGDGADRPFPCRLIKYSSGDAALSRCRIEVCQWLTCTSTAPSRARTSDKFISRWSTTSKTRRSSWKSFKWVASISLSVYVSQRDSQFAQFSLILCMKISHHGNHPRQGGSLHNSLRRRDEIQIKFFHSLFRLLTRYSLSLFLLFFYALLDSLGQGAACEGSQRHLRPVRKSHPAPRQEASAWNENQTSHTQSALERDILFWGFPSAKAPV